MALTIGELVGFLKIDDSQWARKITNANRDMEGLRDAANSSTTALVSLAMSITKAATAGATLAAVAQAGSAASGAIGLIPAAALGAYAAITALKIGMDGFADTLTAADPAAFAEGLKELSPNAAATAVAVRGFRDEWAAMQDVVQDQLFEGLAKHIQPLASSYIPVLSKGLGGIAAQFNYGAQTVAGFLAEAEQVQTVSGFFLNVRKATSNLMQGLQPIVQILMDIAAVGAEMLPELTSGFGGAAQRAADFVRAARDSGQLKEWIQGGLNALGDVYLILRHIIGAVKAVFGGLSLGGGDALGALEELTWQLQEFLQSAEAQEALASLGQVMRTVAGVTSGVLFSALEALVPVIIQAAPAFAALTEQVGTLLVGAIQTAGPLLVTLAGFIADNIGWLGPLAVGLYGAVQAFQAVTVAIKIMNAISALNPWVLIIAATIALAVLIVSNWDEITAAVAVAWQWLQDRGAEVWGWIERNIIDHITSAADWVGRRIQDVIDFFAWLGALPGRVAGWFSDLKVAAIGKLTELVNWVSGLPGRILNALGNLGNLLVEAGKDLIRGIVRGLGQAAAWIWEKLKELVAAAWDGVLDFFGIASPSKEGIWAGKMIGLGLIQGLDAMAGPVGAAALRLAESVKLPVAPQQGGVGADAGPFGTRSGLAGSTSCFYQPVWAPLQQRVRAPARGEIGDAAEVRIRGHQRFWAPPLDG